MKTIAGLLVAVFMSACVVDSNTTLDVTEEKINAILEEAVANGGKAIVVDDPTSDTVLSYGHPLTTDGLFGPRAILPAHSFFMDPSKGPIMLVMKPLAEPAIDLEDGSYRSVGLAIEFALIYVESGEDVSLISPIILDLPFERIRAKENLSGPHLARWQEQSFVRAKLNSTRRTIDPFAKITRYGVCTAQTVELGAFVCVQAVDMEADAELNDEYVNQIPTVKFTKLPEGVIFGGHTNVQSAEFHFVGQDADGEIAGYECSIDSGLFKSCVSPARLENLFDGPHAFAVQSVDNLGLTSSPVAEFRWVVDTIPPDTGIVSMPPLLSNSSTALFGFVGIGGVGRYECQLDGGVFVSCDSPASFGGLSDGSHSLAVRAVDLAGNADPVPDSYSWVIDTIPPATSLDTIPAPVVNVANMGFSFSSIDGVAFECQLGGSGYSTCSSPQNYTGLVDGTYVFSVRAVDSAGNRDASPETATWIVDTTAPSTSIDSAPSAQTNSSSASVYFSSTDGVSYECSLNGVSFVPCSSPVSYSGLPEGVQTVLVRATDAIGNTESPGASASWTVDTIPPTTSLDNTPGAMVNNGNASFSFSSVDASEFECSLDGGMYSSCSNPQTYSGLVDGAHTFTVRAIDAAGNRDLSPATHNWTIDTSGPETYISSGPAASTNSTTAVFSFAGTDAVSFECSLDGGAFSACTSPKSYSGLAEGSHSFWARGLDGIGNPDPAPPVYNWTVDTVAPATNLDSAPQALTNSSSASLAFSTDDGVTFECSHNGSPYTSCTSPVVLTGLVDGLQTCHIRAIDAAGNVDASPLEVTWTVDTVPPATSLDSAPQALTNANTASITFDTDNGASFECSLNGGAYSACSSPLVLVGLGEGIQTCQIRAVDAAGNVDATPLEVAWTVDTVPPSTSLDSAPQALTNTNSASIEFDTDNGASFECSVNGGAYASCSSPLVLAGLGEGLQTCLVRAIDAAGNIDPTPLEVTWTVDTVAPATNLDSAPQALTNSSSASLAFSTDNGVSYECSHNGSLYTTCTSPVLLSGLLDGLQTCHVRAIDAAGNIDASPLEITWTVDTTPPTTSLDSAPQPLTNTNVATIEFDSDSGASYECSVNGSAYSPCTSPLVLTGLSEGVQTCNVRAIDAAGNVDGSPVEITWVVDTIPPATSLESAPDPLTNTNDATIEFDTDTGSTYECSINGGAYVVCASPLELTGLSEGVHTCRVRAVDAAGNVDDSPVEITWTVDTIPPATNLESAPLSLTNSSTATIEFDTDDGASYECSVDGGVYAPCTSPLTLPALSEGSHTCRVRAIDAAGNVDESPLEITWTVDTVPPATNLDSAPQSLTNTSSATLVFSTDDGVSYECSHNGSAYTTCSSPVDLNGLSEGLQTCHVRAVDAAGNRDSTPLVISWTVDTVPPDTYLETTHSNEQTNSTSFAYAATGYEGTISNVVTATFDCQLDSGGFSACDWTDVIAGLDNGTHLFEVRAIDTAGNIDPSPTSVTWVVDTVAPTAGFDSAPASITNSDDAFFAFSSTEGGTFTCWIDAGDGFSCASPVSVTDIPDGSHEFAVRMRDWAGNAADLITHSWTVDTVAPDSSFTSVPDATSSLTNVSISFVSPGAATTYCEFDWGGVQVCSSPWAINGITDGNHTVAVYGEDAAGNLEFPGEVYSWTVDTSFADTMIDSSPSSTTNQTSAQFTFSSPSTAAHTFECSLNYQAFGTCTSPQMVVGLEGGNNFAVRARKTDTGVLDPIPAEYNWNVDTIPPAASFVSAPVPITNVSEITLQFDADESATFVCTLDAGPSFGCASPLAITVADGSHTLAVVAVDLAGNESVSAATYSWQVDTIAPVATIVSGPPATGTDTSATISFSVNDVSATTTCILDGFDYPGCASPMVFSGLSIGAHTFSVVANDGFGNQQTTPSVIFWTITSPGVTLPETLLLAKPLPITTDTTAQFEFSADLTDVEFVCSIDGGPDSLCTSPLDLSGLSYAKHTFEVYAQTISGGHADPTPVQYSWEVTDQLASQWLQVSAGANHACAIAADNSMYCWGSGGHGRLGNGTTASQNRPTAVASDLAWHVVSAGASTTCGIDSDQALWCWGNNFGAFDPVTYGTSQKTPRMVNNSILWSDVKVSAQHLCATDASNNLYCWGNADDGKLGYTDNLTYETGLELVELCDEFSCWQEEQEVLILASVTSPIAVTIGTVDSFDVGTDHSCAVVSGGELYCWGSNSSMQLGNGTYNTEWLPVRVGTDSDWSDVALGAAHSCGIRSNNLYCFGETSKNEIVPASQATFIGSPTQISSGVFNVTAGDGLSCWDDSLGEVYCRGTFEAGSPLLELLFDQELGYGITHPVSFGQFDQLDAGGGFVCGVTDADLACAGGNTSGQLGIGYDISTEEPQQIGSKQWLTVQADGMQACGIDTDNKLYCWGYSGIGDAQGNLRTEPVQIGTSANWVTLEVGPLNYCALNTLGELYCGGSDELWITGNKGNGSTELALIDTGPYKDISQPLGRACGVKPNDSLWCWGQGADSDWLSTVPKLFSSDSWSSVAIGPQISCGVKTDSTLWCWAEADWIADDLMNDYGWGSTLPTQIGSDNNWVDAEVSFWWGCGTRTDQRLHCFGYNEFNMLSTDSTDFLVEPVDVTLQPVSQVDVGLYQTCGVSTDTSVYCAGMVGEVSGAVLDTYPEASGFMANLQNLGIYNVPYGILGLSGFSQASGGLFFGCGIKTNGDLWCWGDNSFGQVGNGLGGPVTQPASALPGIGILDSSAPQTMIRSIQDENGDELVNLQHKVYVQETTEGSSVIELSIPDLVFGYVADETVHYECSLDGAAYIPCGTTFQTGVLSEGPHSFQVRGVDLAGNIETEPVEETEYSYSNPFEWILDVTAPDTTILSGPTQGATTAVRNPMVTYASTEAGGTYRIWLDGSVYRDGITESFVQLNLMANGEHTLLVQAIDRVGNMDESAAFVTWTVDAPITTDLLETPSALESSNLATFTFASNVTGAYFWCSLDGGGSSLCTSPQILTGLPDGEHTFSVFATSDTETQSFPSHHTWVVDTTPPDTLIVLGPTDPSFSSSVTFVFDVVDAGSADDAVYQCSINGAKYIGCSSTPTFVLKEVGSQTISVRAVDGAGNIDPSPAQYAWNLELAWASVSAGGERTCGIDVSGGLWCWGDNRYGWLVADAADILTAPTKVHMENPATTPAPWVDVAVDGEHTCAIDGNTELYCWGYGWPGILGTGDSSSQRYPTYVGNTFDQVSLGDEATCGISGGELFCWGGEGSIGMGENTGAESPLQVTGAGFGPVWSTISVGWDSACGIANGGALYCFGQGNFGDGQWNSYRAYASSVGPYSDWVDIAHGWTSCGIRSNGSLWCWGSYFSNTATQIGSELDWESVQAGANIVCATRMNADFLWCAGDNSNGQVTLPAGYLGSTFHLAATSDDMLLEGVYTLGSSHVCRINPDAELLCRGSNSSGQLGIAELVHALSPEFVTAGVLAVEVSNDSVCIGDQMDISCAGASMTTTHTFVDYSGYGNALTFSSNGSSSCFVNDNAKLYCEGINYSYQLGLGDTAHRSNPEQVGASDWKSISVPPSTWRGGTCGIQSDNTLWCWGEDSSGYGYLGLGNATTATQPTQVGVASNWVTLSVGQRAACAVQDDGSLWCWGADDTENPITEPIELEIGNTWTSLSVGTGHICLISTANELWCSGSHNYYGQLGQDAPGGYLAGSWSDVSAGDSHTCAIKTDGTLWCWGANVYGALGRGYLTNEFEYDETNGVPQQVGSATNWRSVSVDSNWGTSCAVNTSDEMHCWGNNKYGQLGLGNLWHGWEKVK